MYLLFSLNKSELSPSYNNTTYGLYHGNSYVNTCANIGTLNLFDILQIQMMKYNSCKFLADNVASYFLIVKFWVMEGKVA